MTTRDNRGGPRTPENPAPVSGPGRLSQRTDGGQPIRVPSGMNYGEAGRLREIQQSAPMEQNPVGPPASQTQGGPPTTMEGRLAGGIPSLTAPTQMPQQSIMTGVAGQEGGIPSSAEEVLRILVQAFPSPYLIRMLREARGR
jgi:hypothetical protein